MLRHAPDQPLPFKIFRMPLPDRLQKNQRRMDVFAHHTAGRSRIAGDDRIDDLPVVIDRDTRTSHCGYGQVADAIHPRARQAKRAPGVRVAGQHQDLVVEVLVGGQVR